MFMEGVRTIVIEVFMEAFFLIVRPQATFLKWKQDPRIVFWIFRGDRGFRCTAGGFCHFYSRIRKNRVWKFFFVMISKYICFTYQSLAYYRIANNIRQAMQKE